MKGTAIESFFVALGFDVDDKGVEEFDRKLESVKTTALAFGAAIAGAALAIGAFTAHVAGELDDLGDFAERENVSAQAVQELGHAAQKSGSSIEAIKSSIEGMNRVTGEAVLGIGRGAKIFEHLGMEAKNSDGSIKTFDELLGEVAEKMQGLSRQEQVAMAEKLGLDRSLIPLLLKGKEGIQALRDEAKNFGVVDEEGIRQAGEFADTMDDVKAVIKGTSEIIAVKFIPIVGQLLKNFRDWVLANREIIVSRLDTFVKILGVAIDIVWSGVSRLVSALATLVGWIIDSKVAIVLLTLAFGLLIKTLVWDSFAVGVVQLVRLVKWFSALQFASIAASIGTALVAASIGLIIAAIVLLVQDYQSWKAGNDSVIGQILAQYPQVVGWINRVKDAAHSVAEAFQSVSTWIVDSIFKVKELFSAAKNFLSLGFGGASMKLPGMNIPQSQQNSGQNGQPGPFKSSLGGSGMVNNHASNIAVNNTYHIKSTDPKEAAKEVSKTQLLRNVSRNIRSGVAV